MAERLRLGVCGEAFAVNDISINCSVSFGVALVSGEYDLDEAIKCADSALYTAKDTGRNKVAMHEV